MGLRVRDLARELRELLALPLLRVARLQRVVMFVIPASIASVSRRVQAAQRLRAERI